MPNCPQVGAHELAICRVLMCALPIAQITMGAVYLNDCPQQQYIPIYLLVMGSFALVLSVLRNLPCIPEPIYDILNSVASVFLLCWFIAGSVWTYSIYPANYNQTQPNIPFCNRALYLFTFWTTTVVYMFFALCCCVVVYLCLRRKARLNAEGSSGA